MSAGRSFQADPDCAEHGETPAPAEELTPIGVQLVIPGCERREPDAGPKQGSLW